MTARTPTYGRLEAQGDRWVLSGVPPHIAIRLKNIFARIPKTQTEVFTLPLSDEMSADLAWFLSRFPMEMSATDRDRLEGGRLAFENDRIELEGILLPEWQPSSRHGFRPGRDAYHYQKQASEIWLRRKSLLLGDGLGLGKEQPLTAKVLTPNGWARMGELRLGSAIIGKDGRRQHVIGIYPQGIKPAYRVTFTDGSFTECGAEHLWAVRDENRRRRGNGWAVKPLHELQGRGIVYADGMPKWEVPLVDPVEFGITTLLPVHPYILGALLGDGYLIGPTVTISAPSAKMPIVDRIAGIVGAERITGPHGSPGSEQWSIVGLSKGQNDIRRALVDLGVCVPSRGRAVPAPYMTAPPTDRLELLRGLMDTDGSSVRGRVTFHTCSEHLAADVADIVRGLGGTAKIRRYDRSAEGKPMEWQVAIRLNVNPFHLPYKAKNWSPRNTYNRPRRFITSVEYVGDVEQQCIAVSAPDHLYVTDDYVVTHNTVSALHGLAGSPYLPAAIVVQAHLPDQWVDEFIKPFTYMQAHIIKGTKPYRLPPANLYVFRYTNIHGWVDVAATGMFKAVVFDEIQDLRQGTETQKGKAAKVFADNAAIRLGLSGTPIFNYGGEVWNVLSFIDPDVLGPFDEFTREWCTWAGNGKFKVNDPDALGSYLREAGVYLRRTGQGRRVNRIPIEVDYDEEVVADSEQLARKLAMKLSTGSFVERGQAARELDMFARLQTGLAKAKSVAALAKMYLQRGTPLIIGAWHREVYRILLEELADFNPVMFTGSESPAQKNKAKKALMSGASDVMLISLRSGAGVDGFQKRCSTVMFAEQDWSPGPEAQLVGRVDRPGQMKDEIDVIYPWVNFGSDPVLMAVKAIKADQLRGINDPGAEPAAVYTDESRIKLLAQSFLEKSP